MNSHKMNNLNTYKDISTTLIFFVNGKKVVENHPDPLCMLIKYLRDNLNLTSVKRGCSVGSCGSCTVMVSKIDRKTKKIKHFAIMACLQPICSLHGCAITTVEGIGSATTRLHPIQECLAKANGVQCGFCTPGFVMSFYTLIRNKPKPNMMDLAGAFEGNVCRCTGYRSIIEGIHSFTCEMQSCCQEKDCFQNNNENDNNCHYTPNDISQEPIFPPELQLNEHFDTDYLIFQNDSITWYRPNTLKKLIELKIQFPKGKLIVGNTVLYFEYLELCKIHNVFICTKSVPEMIEMIDTNDGVYFGAAVTLSMIEEKLNESISNFAKHETRFFAIFNNMLQCLSSRQVRNVASLVGNIMASSPLSDLNILLAAAKVKLIVMTTIKDRAKREIFIDEYFFTGYHQNVITNDDIILGMLFPKTLPNQYLFTHKQARRRTNDTTIVNIALSVTFQPNSNIVKEAIMAFGGVCYIMKIVKTSCNLMINAEWNEDLLLKVIESLYEELPLDDDAVGGMVKYRRLLVSSLFFKAFLNISNQLIKDGVMQEDFINDEDRSGGDQISMPEWISKITYPEIMKIHQNKQIEHNSIYKLGHKHATGESNFCADVPPMRNELFLTLVVSTRAHAKIISIDATEALKMHGVHAFFSSSDLPPERNSIGLTKFDEYVFAHEIVHCQGQVIGAIVADNEALSREASRAVHVVYENLTPILTTIHDAIDHQSYITDEPLVIKYGDIDKAFAEADLVFENSCCIGPQKHLYLETQSAIAIPGNSNEIQIIASVQSPKNLQELVSHVLALPYNRIVISAKHVGGSHGGKLTRSMVVALPVALACHKLRRPVRCLLERQEDMIIIGARHPFLFNYKVGCTNEGKLTACDIKCYSNAGWSTDLSISIMRRAINHFENCYHIPNIKVAGWICRTNLPSSTAGKGFGGPQAMFAGENIIREVAYMVKKDYVEVMQMNFFHTHDVTHYNQILNNVTINRCFTDCLNYSNFYEKRKEVEEFNKQNRWRKRGVSIVPTLYGIAGGAKHLNQAGAFINVYLDGSVLLSHSSIDTGQGVHSKMMQVAATAFGISMDFIHISETATDKVPNTSPLSTSISAELNTMSVLEACSKINKRLKPLRKLNPNYSWKELIQKAYHECISLSATGFYKLPNIGYDPELRPDTCEFNHFNTGAGVSVVEIDCLSGDHRVLSTEIVMDIGSSLSPIVDVGQIEGAYVQGYGLFVLERIKYGTDGHLITQGLNTYKVPGISDIPSQFYVKILTESPISTSSSTIPKAVGDSAFFLGSAAYFAIKEAIGAARVQNGYSENFFMKAPATSSRIRRSCLDTFTVNLDLLEKTKTNQS